MEKGDKCWSLDEERYDGCFQSVCDDAFEDVDPDTDEIRTIWEGESQPYRASTFMRGTDHLIEDLRDSACEEAGEFSENWLANVTATQEEALAERMAKVIDEWAEEFGHQPKFWTVENVRQLKIRRVDDGSYEEVK